MREYLSFESYKPLFPDGAHRFGIAIVGCGWVANKWHIPQYLKHGLRLVGCWDSDPSAITKTRTMHADLIAFDSFDALLADANVSIVDIATTVSGRAQLIRKALAAGKHVLAQKPICRNATELNAIEHAVAQAPSVHLAVNFNGRWAPPWRAATRLIEAGEIGDVLAITHFHDFQMSWLPDLERHGSLLFLLFDYMVHWVDISLVWSNAHGDVRVWSSITPLKSPGDKELATQIGWLNFTTRDNISVTIRSVPAAFRYSGHSFVVHGTTGTLRGSVDSPLGGDFLEIECGNSTERLPLTGSWFPDGFGGTMGELLCAVAEQREPENNFLAARAAQQITLAACQSAENDGKPIDVSLP